MKFDHTCTGWVSSRYPPHVSSYKLTCFSWLSCHPVAYYTSISDDILEVKATSYKAVRDVSWMSAISAW